MKKKILVSLVAVVGVAAVLSLKPVIAAVSGRSSSSSSQVPVAQAWSQPAPSVYFGYTADPLAQMEYLQQEVNQAFDNGFTGWGANHSGNSGQMSFMPAMDMEGTASHYVITMDLPGMQKGAIKLQEEGHRLIVSGQRKSAQTQKNKVQHYYWQERSFGAFSRVVTLPKDALMAKINATYKNGVLTITVPKRAWKKHAKSLKQIKIN